MQKEIDKTGEDMLYLITCALHNQTPDIKKVGDMDFEAVYRYARLLEDFTPVTAQATVKVTSNFNEGSFSLYS